MRTRTLTTREESVVNSLRKTYGFTINEVADLFGVSKDVVVNANPSRRAKIKKYNAAK